MRQALIAEVCRIRPHIKAEALAQVNDENLIKLLSSHAAQDRRHCYQARVMIDGVRVSLGYFTTRESAQAAVAEAKFKQSIGLPFAQCINQDRKSVV